MSLLQNLNGWLTSSGEPVQGITPPSVRLRSGVLTPERRAGAQDAFNRFQQAKKLSLAGTGYFAGDELLPDGTRVRMISINGVDHVHIWAIDPPPAETVDVTFWCQPLDEGWVVAQYEEVFTIPRWIDINNSDADVDNDSDDFLDDLSRNPAYEPVGAARRYPGNLTWFAPGTGLVVSWWGQMRRYSASLLDQTIDEAKSWLRPTDPREAFLTAPPAGGRVGPTGGVAGALAGQLFHKEGVGTLPPGLPTPLPTFPRRSSNRLWANGAPVDLPVGYTVSSACSGFRSGKAVLRATAVYSGSLLVFELNPDTRIWDIIGMFDMSAETLGVPHPDVVNGSPLGPEWLPGLQLEHPFYWNASGTKAIGLVRFTRNTSILTLASIVHAAVELTVSGSSCTLALIDYSGEVETQHTVSEDDTTYPGSFSEVTTHTSTTDLTRVNKSILAADYRGETLVILRSHINETLSRSESYLFEKHGTETEAGVRYTYETTESVTQTSDLSTWASVNNTAITATSESRSSSLDHNEHRYESELADSSTASEDTSYEASGRASIWGISAGDLRGEFVIHSQPLYGVSDIYEADRDSTYNYAMTASYPSGGGGGSSATATFSKTLRTDTGRMLRMEGMTATELTKLIHPQWLERIGSGTQNWADGVLTTSSRSGPYGDGPVWTDFAHPSTSQSFGDTDLTINRTRARSRNYMNWTYPSGSPSTTPPTTTTPITSFVGGGASGPGAFANTVLVGCALTPDLRVQYTGALFVAMCQPSAPTTPMSFMLDRWTVDGAPFTPPYPDQPDPENPGETVPFPHRGGHALLLNPIFTGPLP